MIGLLILSMVGVIDDLIRIDYRRKFVAQIVASLFLPLSGLWINDLYGLLGITTLSPWIGMPLTVFVAVFIINAVNLIDGIDGLCSGLVGMGALVFGFLFIYNGAWLHAVFAFITAGVLCPFFYYNVFGKSKGRQRIFMGDTGSLTLGLSMAFLAISYAMNNPLIKPFSEGAIVVSFATLTVANTAHTPITTIRLKMFEPTTLLTASSLLPVSDADTLTAVSGSDVPIATIVSPIIIDGTCSLFATLELPSTKKSAPLISSTNPITRNTSTSANGALLINFSIFSSFFP